jgi:hypothetical protein
MADDNSNSKNGAAQDDGTATLGETLSVAHAGILNEVSTWIEHGVRDECHWQRKDDFPQHSTQHDGCNTLRIFGPGIYRPRYNCNLFYNICMHPQHFSAFVQNLVFVISSMSIWFL